MAPLDDTTPATRFDSFDVHRTSYKKIGDHEIEVGILIPKDLKPGKHPLVAKFHGGGLVRHVSQEFESMTLGADPQGYGNGSLSRLDCSVVRSVPSPQQRHRGAAKLPPRPGV